MLEKAGERAGDIAAIGIANQRETTLLWERATGARSHTPSCGRTDAPRRNATQLQAQGHERPSNANRAACSMRISLRTKLSWLLDDVPGARARAERGELAFGTVDSWLICNLTGSAPTSRT